MLAKAVKEFPEGNLLYEPKWDGFRCIVFRDGDEVELASRNQRPLARYFPELLQPLATSCRDDAWSTASSSCRPPTDSTSTSSVSASTLRRHASRCCRGPRRRASWRSTCSRSTTSICARYRSRRAATRWSSSSVRRRHRSTSRLPRPIRRWPRLVRTLRGIRIRRGHGQAARRHLRRGPTGAVQGQAPSHRRLRGRRIPAPQGGRCGVAAAGAVRRRRPRAAGRRGCTTWGSPAGSPPHDDGRCWPSCRCSRTVRSTSTPG